MCVCTLSSWIQHSILFPRFWELQSSIFLGSRSWQKCKCNIPDGENLHADSMYPWLRLLCTVRGNVFCLVTAAVSALTRHSGTRSWRHGLGCGILADLHYRAPTRRRVCVRARTQWRWTQNTVTLNTEHSDVARVPSKSHRYDVREVEFKKLTPIFRDFCLSGLKRVFDVFCKFQVVLRVDACPRRPSGP